MVKFHIFIFYASLSPKVFVVFLPSLVFLLLDSLGKRTSRKNLGNIFNNRVHKPVWWFLQNREIYSSSWNEVLIVTPANTWNTSEKSKLPPEASDEKVIVGLPGHFVSVYWVRMLPRPHGFRTGRSGVLYLLYLYIYIYTYMCAYPSLKPMVNLQSSDTNMSRNYFTASYCVILILCHTHTIISESKCLN